MHPDLIAEQLYNAMQQPPDRKTWRRFLRKFSLPDENACWEWKAYLNPAYYGQFRLRNYKHGLDLATRVIMTWLYGPIQATLVVDHMMCNNPPCINPQHLHITSQRENLLRSDQTLAGKCIRKTHCPQGHAYSFMNTRISYKRGCPGRTCRKCDAIKQALKRQHIKRGDLLLQL
jgi:hypothetical protein